MILLMAEIGLFWQIHDYPTQSHSIVLNWLSMLDPRRLYYKTQSNWMTGMELFLFCSGVVWWTMRYWVNCISLDCFIQWNLHITWSFYLKHLRKPSHSLLMGASYGVSVVSLLSDLYFLYISLSYHQEYISINHVMGFKSILQLKLFRVILQVRIMYIYKIYTLIFMFIKMN